MNWLIKFLAKRIKPIEGNPNEFLERPWRNGWRQFLIGSVHGLYRTKDKEYQILAIHNTKGGNGHFEKTMEWFEKSAKRDKYKLSFLEIENPKLREKLSFLGFIGDKNKMIKNSGGE